MKIWNVYVWRDYDRASASRTPNPLRMRFACYATSASAVAKAWTVYRNNGKNFQVGQLKELQECLDPTVIAACKATPGIVQMFGAPDDEVQAVAKRDAEVAHNIGLALTNILKKSKL